LTRAIERVRDFMTADLVTLNHNDKLSIADDVMRLGRIRHLPVLDDDGELVGIVSQRDLFHSALVRALGYGTHAAKAAMESFAVKDAMHTDLVTIAPHVPLTEAARLMVERKVGCLLVVDEGKLVGVLTEGDFVARFARA
jgi:CBS domain-containing membrane protein